MTAQFFILVGVFSAAGHLCRFLFWFDDPTQYRNPDYQRR